ncbi:hypothetical protein ACHQM5_009059 [Ranunculus cassubicifolius]
MITFSPQNLGDDHGSIDEQQEVIPQQVGRKTTKRSKTNTSGTRFLGVRQRPSGRWVAEIKESSQKLRVWLGTYDRPEDAAMAYDTAAWLLRGKNAKTNFPYTEIIKTQQKYCNLVGKNPRFCQLLRHAIIKKNQYNKAEKLNRGTESVDFNSNVEETIVCSSSSEGCYGIEEMNGQCKFSFGGCKVYSSVIVAPSFNT